VIDVIRELESYGIKAMVYDPVANKAEAKKTYDIDLVALEELTALDAIVAAVAHDELSGMDISELASRCNAGVPFIDIKSVYDRVALESHGFKVWRL